MRVIETTSQNECTPRKSGLARAARVALVWLLPAVSQGVTPPANWALSDYTAEQSDCQTPLAAGGGPLSPGCPDCDDYDVELLERPTVSTPNPNDPNTYYPWLDIARTLIGEDGNFYYFAIDLVRTNNNGQLPYYYAWEMDFDLDNRGDFLLVESDGSSATTNWGQANLVLWQDTDNDVGGADPLVAEGSGSFDGFDNEYWKSGDSPSDGAWVRIHPSDKSMIELALKRSLVGSPTNGSLRGWSQKGNPSRSDMYYHDKYNESSYGSPCTNSPYYPPGNIYEVDNSAGVGDFLVLRSADLELTKTASATLVYLGDQIQYTLVVTNKGKQSATGVVVEDQLPAGVSYLSDDGAGAYSTNTGWWTLGALSNGAARTLNITVSVAGSGVITNLAQVLTSDLPDPDSTPGNDDAAEDDQDSVTLTVLSADLQGQVRHDTDGDGDPADADSGLEGVTVVLFSDPNRDGDPADGQAARTNVTDSGGAFLFSAVATGHFVAVEHDLSGMTSTADSQGANDNQVAIHMPGGQSSTTNWFLDRSSSGLAISKAASQTQPFDPGQTVSYTITVWNVSGSTHGNTTVTDLLPADLSYIATSSWVVLRPGAQTVTVRDEFTSVAYTNNNGATNWSGNWIEINESDGAAAGDEMIVTDMSSGRLRVQDNDGGGEGARRMANLSAATSATLSFDYRRNSLDDTNDYVTLDVSTNGATWTELARFSGAATDGAYRYTNYSLSAYLSTGTQVRFLSSPNLGASDMVYFDNVQIQMTVPGAITTNAASAPPTLVSNYLFGAGSRLTLWFQAQVTSPDQVVNQAIVTSSNFPAGLIATITNGVDSVVMTQGVAAVETNPDAACLAWTAATDTSGVIKAYDLMYLDRTSPGFDATTTGEWGWVTTVTNSFFVDAGGGSRAAPGDLGDAMRFYRAAHQFRWQTNQQPRLATREIYVLKNILLQEGENWISLFMVPDSNSLARVLGTNTLPADSQISTSTRIEWYGATQNGLATNQVWLSNSGHWLFNEGGVANNLPLPLNEGFNLVLPPGSGSRNLMVIGRVPTNTSAAQGHVHTLKGSGTYNVVSYNLPYKVRLADSGLREAGYKGAPAGQIVNPNNSDEIRIMQRGGGSLASPKVRILMDNSGQFVYWTGGSGSAENYEFNVDDALIIYTRAGTSNLNWSLQLPYPAPTRQINP